MPPPAFATEVATIYALASLPAYLLMAVKLAFPRDNTKASGTVANKILV